MSYIKGVINKSSAPTVNDDNTKGFYIGFEWVDDSTDTTYQCADVSTGAAVWNVSSSAGANGNSFQLSAGRNSLGINVDIDLIGAEVTTAETPYIMPKAGKLYGISAAHAGSAVGKEWTADILKNGVSAATLELDEVEKNQRSDLNVSFAEGDTIRLRLILTALTINRPRITAFFKLD